MTDFDNLKDAFDELHNIIAAVPVRVFSIEDIKTVEEKIKITKETLMQLRARLLELQSYFEYQTGDEPEEDVRDTVASLHEETANNLINDNAIKLCLHSFTIQTILEGRKGGSEMQEKIYTYMQKLYSLNQSTLSLQKEIEKASQKQLELKIKCQTSLFEYRDYLKEQEEIHTKKLQETQPQVARDKQHTILLVRKINIMKRLIVSFIVASHEMLLEKPLLVEMLEKHRDLITMETISKPTESKIQDEQEDENIED